MVESAEKKWNDLVLPYRLEFQREDDKNFLEIVAVEPLERGFGVTLGNAMRRVLLSSLTGAAVTSVRIEGICLEFSSISGVTEDVSDIVMNLKNLNLWLSEGIEGIFRLEAKGPCVVTGAMIDGAGILEVMNPELVICTLDEDAHVVMHIRVEKGIGYVSSEKFQKRDVGDLVIDAWFSPVRNVSFQVESVGFSENEKEYERLLLTVETNGTISPELAVSQAATILRDKLGIFVRCSEIKENSLKGTRISEEKKTESGTFPSSFYKKITELDLSVRCVNCLSSEGVVYVGDLVRKKESDLMKTPNFGRKSLGDIQNALAAMGLTLGMECTNWPPEHLGEICI